MFLGQTGKGLIDAHLTDIDIATQSPGCIIVELLGVCGIQPLAGIFVIEWLDGRVYLTIQWIILQLNF